MEEIVLDYPGRDGLADCLGLAAVYRDGEVVRARVPVSAALLQPFGIVHGGAHAAIAESVCNHATNAAVADDGLVGIGMSNSTTFLRPVGSGHLDVAARTRHEGRTTWVWDVEIADAEGRVCALARVVIAVRPARGLVSRESDS